MKQSPGILIALIVVVLVQIGVVLTQYPAYFTSYTDSVVILLFLLGIYLVWQYFKAKSQLPERICQPILPTNYIKKVGAQTNEKLDELKRNPKFIEFIKNKQAKILGQQRKMNEPDTDPFVLELEQKTSQIFDS